MRYGSVCSGIEAAGVAWKEWTPLFVSEVNPYCNAVLSHHFPQVPNLGDFTQIGDIDDLDLLVGGTPCQSFSLAGNREGVDDSRGNLALEFVNLVERTQPRWVVWENVPGVLSANNRKDFKEIIQAYTELGYSCSWRILDAQYFGVPQRRRRLYLVGHRDWRSSTAALFDSASLSADYKGSRDKGKDYTEDSCHRITDNLSGTLQTTDQQGPGSYYNGGLRGVILDRGLLRKRAVVEAERLMGFEDNYTLVPYKNRMMSDKQRYKMLGNSMVVPVMKWIGERIEFIDSLPK